MKGNFVAKHMNTINRSSVHKYLKREFSLDNLTWVKEELRGCTADTLYIDDSEWPKEECSDITEEQLKDFYEFTKELMRKYPVKFYTPTYIDRTEK